jgi:hypothetical protein
MGPDGLRTCAHSDSDLSLEEVVQSLEERSVTDCNEWVLRDYDVLGVLFQPPFIVSTQIKFATPRDMAAVFAEWPWFTITPDGLHELTSDFKIGGKIPIDGLYPTS